MPISAPPESTQSSSSRRSMMSGISRLHKAVSVLKQPALLASVGVTALLLGVRHLGLLQPLEVSAFDQSLRLRPAVAPDPRLLVVTITEEDLQAQKKWPLPDAVIHQLLEKLERYQPAAIGLDNYRDIPVEPGHQQLKALMAKSDRIVPVCKLKGSDSPEVPPPPSVPIDRLGFSDVLADLDGVIRRSLLYVDPISNARCNTRFSLSFQLALRYLKQKGIEPKINEQNSLQLGNVVFKQLEATSGGYQNLDARAYQIMLNYRAPDNTTQEITLTQVLNGNLQPEWVKDRIVLIGSTAGSLKDYFFTPYSPGRQRNPKMAGVVVHAQMTSQIISAVLDGRPLLWFWSDWQEALWICCWSVCGGILAWRLRHPVRLGLAGGIGLVVLLGTSWVLFLQSGWVPVVPPALALVLTGGSVVACNVWQAQQEREKIIQQVREQEKIISQLKAFKKNRGEETATRNKAPSEEETLGATALAGDEETLGATALADDEETLGATALADDEETLGATALADDEETLGATALAGDEKTDATTLAFSQELGAGDKQKKDLSPSSERNWRSSLLKGRYKILRVLGAGGFGLTYMAEDTQRPGNPRCVVKHLRPARRDEKFMNLARRLFNTEADILEKLGNHNQIPQLLAYFEENQEFYLVQELIEGHSLSEEIPVDKRLPEEEVVEVLRSVLEILDFIHQHRVIHRDIKPSNIIRREQDGRLVLIDFGAVKEIQPQEFSEQEDRTVAIGTRGYTPAEQLHGQPRVTSDIYALGMIGVQAVTGIQPHQLKEDAITGDISWREFASCGEDFAQILDKMVRYHFMERYQSASEVLQDLKRL